MPSHSALLLSWSHYVRLLTVPEAQARNYHESESLRGGWSVRGLDRQIASHANERLRQKGTAAISKADRPPAEGTESARIEATHIETGSYPDRFR